MAAYFYDGEKSQDESAYNKQEIRRWLGRFFLFRFGGVNDGLFVKDPEKRDEKDHKLA